MKYPNTIQNLIECFKKLPGIGEKTAERLALSVLELDEDTINLFSKSIKDSATKIKRCSNCNNLSEEDLCEICKNKNRNKNVLCVVEEPKNVILFEKLNIFDGYYHVLDGLISPIDGINPEDINLEKLIKRVEKDKAWETSMTRKICIMILTYIVVVIYSYIIKKFDNILLSSLVPVIGFTLSTLSLKLILLSVLLSLVAVLLLFSPTSETTKYLLENI